MYACIAAQRDVGLKIQGGSRVGLVAVAACGIPEGQATFKASCAGERTVIQSGTDG
jgi:hypothetical protein